MKEKDKHENDATRGARQRIVVVGGGFAGLNFVKHIDFRRFQVTVVDRNNYHSFPPLFYQLASAGLDPASICFPLRREFRKRSHGDIRYNMGRVELIDPARKVVKTQFEELPYDILVIAAGTTNNFFGMDELKKSVYTLKSTSEAIRCRNDILDRLELAAITDDREKRRRLLSFVVVGGGATGVEVAGAIGEMKRYVLRREYPTIDQADMSITLLEGTDRVLGAMSVESSRKALDYLDHLMVNVRLETIMKSYDGHTVTLNDGSTLPASMLVWTAGVTGVAFEIVGAPDCVGRGNRLKVDCHCRVEGLDCVYALGDIALMTCDPRYPHGHPQLAQVAIQQGRMLAKDINRGAPGEAFRYNDKGSMATVGRNRAVVDLKHVRVYGRPAWFIWMFVHLISILGMRNKITVLINWIWAYFNYSSSLRLLIHPDKYPLRRRWIDGDD